MGPYAQSRTCYRLSLAAEGAGGCDRAGRPVSVAFAYFTAAIDHPRLDVGGAEQHAEGGFHALNVPKGE